MVTRTFGWRATLTTAVMVMAAGLLGATCPSVS